jgi:hypothetical protein
MCCPAIRFELDLITILLGTLSHAIDRGDLDESRIIVKNMILTMKKHDKIAHEIMGIRSMHDEGQNN